MLKSRVECRRMSIWSWSRVLTACYYEILDLLFSFSRQDKYTGVMCHGICFMLSCFNSITIDFEELEHELRYSDRDKCNTFLFPLSKIIYGSSKSILSLCNLNLTDTFTQYQKNAAHRVL